MLALVWLFNRIKFVTILYTSLAGFFYGYYSYYEPKFFVLENIFAS